MVTIEADDSSKVYVHHIGQGAAVAPAPQPQYIPYPVYQPAPYPYGGYPYQQQQPTIVVIKNETSKPAKKDDGGESSGGVKKPNGEGEKKPDEEKPDEKKPDEKKPDEKKPNEDKDKKKETPEVSRFSIASGVLFLLAVTFSAICISRAYDAHDQRMASEEAGEDHTENEAYQAQRTLAIGTGAFAALCFVVGTLMSFYAGMEHKGTSGKDGCLLNGLVIAAWILFSVTFILNLITFLLSFGDNEPVYPQSVVVGFVGGLLSWMLMFGFAEMARRG